MGTDIHGVWQAKKKRGGWFDIGSEYEQDRDYQLFAVLAGVRNGVGFGGVKTGDAVTPIAEARGLPTDFAMNEGDEEAHPVQSIAVMDPRRRRYREDDPKAYANDPRKHSIWMGDHSYSWLTGAEMLAWYEKAPTLTRCGVIDREEFATWQRGTSPHSWSGGVSGGGVIVIDESDVAGEEGWTRDALDQAWTHIRVSWQVDLREDLEYFFAEVKRLIGLHGEIRFVFGFDS